ncbi:CvpA family protein [Desulfovibrio sp. OttesenSCG-928-I05]|nr:CvpA family protein [Desulfovibrio sp. OttesenSCG-928-I05]
MLEVNLLDIGIIVFLLALMVRGFMRGLVQEVAGLVALILGFILARQFQDDAHAFLSQLFGNEEWTYLLSYASVFTLVIMGVSLLAAGLRKLMAVTFTAWLDRLLGGFVGLGKGLLLATAVFYVLDRLLPGADFVQTAQLRPLLDAMIKYLQNFLPSSFIIDPRFM